MFYRSLVLKEYVQGQNFLTSGSLQGVLNDQHRGWLVMRVLCCWFFVKERAWSLNMEELNAYYLSCNLTWMLWISETNKCYLISPLVFMTEMLRFFLHDFIRLANPRSLNLPFKLQLKKRKQKPSDII